MRRHHEQILFSAADLNGFIECNHKTFLNLIDLNTPLSKAETDAHAQLLQKRGIEHETKYVQDLKASGAHLIEIPTQESLKNRIQLTMNAMRNGCNYIVQGALLKGRWHGFVDVMKRVERPSKLGSFSYEAVDIKLSSQAKPKHIIQLCVYSDLLEQYQGIAPLWFSLVLGNREAKDFQFSDFAHYYRVIKQQFEEYMIAPPQLSRPSPCSFCSACQWESICNDQWKNEDHLSQVANIQKSQILKLEANNIRTVETLALLDSEASIPHLSNLTLNRLRSQASLQYTKRETGENKVELLPPIEGKGFSRLPKPDPADLFFDMEGDPLHTPDGLEYLFGFYYLKNGIPIFRPFWAHNKTEEKQAFQEVIAFITDHLSLYPNAHIYHYNHYEETTLKRLASRFGTCESELDNVLRGKKFVDLFKVVRDAIRTSEPGYSIKNLETFYMEKREGAVATATGSLVVYDEWRTTGDISLLKQISDYNEDDCRSTYLLQQWLLKQRPETIKWFELEYENVSEDKKQLQTDKERKKERYEKALLEDTSDQDHQFRELVAHTLEFHCREEKPLWWDLFDRQDKDYDELLDDCECLVGLELSTDKLSYKEKKSTIYTYAFPYQDCKLTVGKQVCFIESLKTIGTIFSLDTKASVIQIKTTLPVLPKSLSITQLPIFANDVLKKAIYRFADAVIEKNNRYPAIEALLKREKPQIIGHKSNKPIIDSNCSIIDTSLQAISNLQNSYLFIQGPPGSGKTYTSSRIIVELIRAGKHVGVSSNSHKAIHNLLSGIEKAAKEQQIQFRGQKKSTSEESIFAGEFIKDVFDNKDINSSFDLIAGTAWLFANEFLDQKLDYLFIDEAGQVSLANFIAMGMSAKNIVLVGDQMQLGQPIRGAHPGDSGMSILEYLLQEKPTISPDRGIFLATTWRMHENICRFISNAVYGGELHPQKDNQNQSLILSRKAHSSLLENGVQFIAAEHQGCTQKSEEEGRIIEELYSTLMQQSYRDREGNVKRMTAENILVVAPYNMQVNYLKSILPKDARVGTVDKFQGQEAEVVLVSMTTSSGEDLPRNIEFLYSKNRLNVAVSRAKTLAVVIANPKLLEIPCNNIDQMRLVNTLCWAKEYALM